MKSGILVFIAMITGLSIAVFCVITMISEYSPRVSLHPGAENGRFDLQDGKQHLLHSGLGTYTQNYRVSMPEETRRVTVEEKRAASMNYWSKVEGHKPFSK